MEITKKCLNCKKEFTKYSNKHSYCSRKCYIDYITKNTIFKTNVCLNCNKIFKFKKLNKHEKDRFYCSQTCFLEKIKEIAKLKQVIKICLTCKKEFTTKRSNTFCSKDCFYISTRGRVPWNKGLKMNSHPSTAFKKGSEHVFWKGGISKEPYPFEFNKNLKIYVRYIYHNKCQICGKTSRTHVHHIDYNKKNICLDNLIPLCRSCHAQTNFDRNYWKSFLTKKVIFLPNTKYNWFPLPGTNEYGEYLQKTLEHAKSIKNNILFESGEL